ncbi:Uncharacterised protein [Actinobaculum suis]|uniref:Uncharacterized protein n=1 Tax=Actinobaculum suis TaxID=1657 RepID=A0A0K9ES88_9ACTO|nr:hypothetical protein ACU19_08215 [Actinobaculum suis]VDG77169.1 Uncharacterised protein [Actinobaculum suis]
MLGAHYGIKQRRANAQINLGVWRVEAGSCQINWWLPYQSLERAEHGAQGGHAGLWRAKKHKNDEFCTQRVDIDRELVHYRQYFAGSGRGGHQSAFAFLRIERCNNP